MTSVDQNGNSFKPIRIGDQEWMAENLNVDKFRNGDHIPQSKTNEEWIHSAQTEEPAWCYYRNDPTLGDELGKLYNWYAVNDHRGLAQKGWHVPSVEEWNTLESYFAMDSDESKLKSATRKKGKGNWAIENSFPGLPGGYRGSGNFHLIGMWGFWWSSSKYKTGAWACNRNYRTGKVNSRYKEGKLAGFSVLFLLD